jgi:hypothetical protein
MTLEKWTKLMLCHYISSPSVPVQSRQASRKGDFYLAAKRGRDTLFLSIGAITFTLVCVFSALIIIFTQGLTQRFEDITQLSFTNDVDMNP